jgi:hypothetical protein
MATLGSNVPKLSTWRFNQTLRKSEFGRRRSDRTSSDSGEDLGAPVLADLFLNT